jgi:hypothetical protein
MKTNLRKAFGALLLVVSGLAVASFSPPDGGDVFEVYVGDKFQFRQIVHSDKSVKEFVITPADYREMLNIKYSHCGVTGKNRVITLRNAQDKILKRWNFPEARSKNSVMACQVSEIVDLQKAGNEKIRLYYSSAELPEGMCLVSLREPSRQSTTRP